MFPAVWDRSINAPVRHLNYVSLMRQKYFCSHLSLGLALLGLSNASDAGGSLRESDPRTSGKLQISVSRL
jgi:hypothetical protein